MFRRITRGIFAGMSVACPGAGVKGRGELVEPDQGAPAAVADRGRAERMMARTVPGRKPKRTASSAGVGETLGGAAGTLGAGRRPRVGVGWT
jgi:hypothetical protein